MLYVVSDIDAKFPCAKHILRPFTTFVFCRKKYVIMCGLRNLDRGRSPYVLFLSNCLRCRKLYSCRNIDKTVFLGKSSSKASTFLLFQIVVLIFLVAMFKSEEKARCGLPQWLAIPRNDTASFLLEVVLCSVSVLSASFFLLYLHHVQSDTYITLNRIFPI